MMRDPELVEFLQWALPRLRLRWEGFRKVRRQVGKRLTRRLAELKLSTLNQYRHRLEDDSAEWDVFDGLCHITISRLYRDKHVFDVLGASVLPELGEAARRQGRALRCWCAGCACGEEVYTLKLLWELDVLPRLRGGQLEIIGSDADPIALRRADKGCFSSSSLKEAPARWRELAFRTDDKRYCIDAKYREGLDFRLQDIRAEIPPGSFDLILCRNLVFTYFDLEQQRELLGRIAGALREEGYLVIGAHEKLPDKGGIFSQVPACIEIFQKARPLPSLTLHFSSSAKGSRLPLDRRRS